MTTPLAHERQLIDILAEIDRTGSISQAATNLFMTQPTVSKLIRNQEKQYGVTLINRDQHPLRLTYAGEYYLDQMQHLVRSYQSVSNNLKAYADAPVGRLSIGVNPSLAPVVLPQLLPEFHRRYPQIQVQLFEQPAATMVQAVLGGDIDLNIGVTNAYGNDLKHRRLFSDTAVLIIPDQLLDPDWDPKPALNIGTLISGQDFIAETDDSGFQRVISSFLTQADANPNVILRTPNLTTALQLAFAGLGATIVPQSLLGKQPVPAGIHALPLPATDIQMDVTISYRATDQLSDAAYHFLDMSRNSFSATKVD